MLSAFWCRNQFIKIPSDFHTAAAEDFATSSVGVSADEKLSYGISLKTSKILSFGNSKKDDFHEKHRFPWSLKISLFSHGTTTDSKYLFEIAIHF